METNMSEAMKKAERENQKAIITHIYKYANFKGTVAVNELMKLDLFKNNFTEATLKNYLRSMRRFLKDGTKTQGQAPTYLYEFAKELQDKHYPCLTPSNSNKFNGFKKKKVTSTPVSITLPETSKQSVSSIINLKNKLELECVTTQNNIKKLQDKATDISSKLNAIKVVMDLLK